MAISKCKSIILQPEKIENMATTQWLDFEKDIVEIEDQLAKARETHEKGKLDMTDTIANLDSKIDETKKRVYGNLTGWQNVQISRHPERPYTLDYIENICDQFIELHGDRVVKDDKAIVGGFAEIDGQSFMIIGHQKGKNTKMRQIRNFGMANPDGYRKALRLMRVAEKFNGRKITIGGSGTLATISALILSGAMAMKAVQAGKDGCGLSKK